eukprot:Rhum_TRINITY_DN8197_c0_g2::Rhum_TRINITY_DN8197_c0_g2_i1::g.26285::m.26285
MPPVPCLPSSLSRETGSSVVSAAWKSGSKNDPFRGRHYRHHTLSEQPPQRHANEIPARVDALDATGSSLATRPAEAKPARPDARRAGLTQRYRGMFLRGDTAAASAAAALVAAAAAAAAAAPGVPTSPSSPSKKKQTKAERKEQGRRGCVVASSGPGNSVRVHWDGGFIRTLQQGAEGQKMPKHGGWNPAILDYLDAPGYVTSMRCGINLQDVWLVKFRDGVEIPLHRDCLYKSLYPQVAAYFWGIMKMRARAAGRRVAPKPAAVDSDVRSKSKEGAAAATTTTTAAGSTPHLSFGAHIMRQDKGIRYLIAKFLFYSTAEGVFDCMQTAFEKACRTAAAPAKIVRRGRAFETIPAVRPCVPSSNATVEVGDFVKKLADTSLSRRQVETITDVLLADSAALRPHTTPPLTRDASVTFAQLHKEYYPLLQGATRKVLPERFSRNTDVVTRRTSAPPTSAREAQAQRSARDGAASEGSGAAASAAAADTASSQQRDRSGAPIEEDTIVKRGMPSMPVSALQDECGRLHQRILELQQRCSADSTAKKHMRSHIEAMQWQLRHSSSPARSTPSRAASPAAAAAVPGQPLCITVECMAAKLSRRLAPSRLRCSTGDPFVRLAELLESHTGITKERQVVALVDAKGKLRRIGGRSGGVSGVGGVGGGGRVAHEQLCAASLGSLGFETGCTVLVSECGRATLDVRIGPSRRVRLQVFPDETLGGVAQTLARSAGGRADDLCLAAPGGRPLGPDTATLWACGVLGGTVPLELRRARRSVSVRLAEGTPESRVVSVDTDPSDTVGRLRRRVEAAAGCDGVLLFPRGGSVSSTEAVPDEVLVREVGAPAFVAEVDPTRQASGRVARQVSQVKSVVAQLSANTAHLQETLAILHAVQEGPPVRPSAAPREDSPYHQMYPQHAWDESAVEAVAAGSPAFALANAVDSTAHLVDTMRYQGTPLDVLRQKKATSAPAEQDSRSSPTPPSRAASASSTQGRSTPTSQGAASQKPERSDDSSSAARDKAGGSSAPAADRQHARGGTGAAKAASQPRQTSSDTESSPKAGLQRASSYTPLPRSGLRGSGGRAAAADTESRRQPSSAILPSTEEKHPTEDVMTPRAAAAAKVRKLPGGATSSPPAALMRKANAGSGGAPLRPSSSAPDAAVLKKSATTDDVATRSSIDRDALFG